PLRAAALAKRADLGADGPGLAAHRRLDVRLASGQSPHSVPLALSSRPPQRSPAGCDDLSALPCRRDRPLVPAAPGDIPVPGGGAVAGVALRGLPAARYPVPSQQCGPAGTMGSPAASGDRLAQYAPCPSLSIPAGDRQQLLQHLLYLGQAGADVPAGS